MQGAREPTPGGQRVKPRCEEEHSAAHYTEAPRPAAAKRRRERGARRRQGCRLGLEETDQVQQDDHNNRDACHPQNEIAEHDVTSTRTGAKRPARSKLEPGWHRIVAMLSAFERSPPGGTERHDQADGRDQTR